MSSTEMVVMPREESVVKAADFMPLLTVAEAVQRKHMINEYIGHVLKDGDDYGLIPGANQKKVLLKPGAEKLCSIFGMAPQYVVDTEIEDWTGADHGGEPLFYYKYRCSLSRGGRFMGEAIGSCSSWESKYRYRWVSEEVARQRKDFDALLKRGGQKTMFEPMFAIEKAETTGKYGKPAEYWQRFEDAMAAGTSRRGKKKMGQREFDGIFLDMDETQYRVPNPEVSDIINTVQKMAQKRALVAAVLVVTNCSDAFTQDIEDFADSHHEPMVMSPEPEPARNLPEDLEALFAKSVPEGAVGKAFGIVKAKLIEAFPQNGEEEYRRILDHNGIKPKGNPISASRNAVMQCWTLAQSALKLKPKPAMSEMPEGQGFPVEDEPAHE